MKFQAIKFDRDATRPFAIVGVPGQGYDYRVWGTYRTLAQAQRRARELSARN